MTLPRTVVRDNPWWQAAAAIEMDPDLARYRAAPVRFEHAIPFEWDRDAIYTLRGPRQVGKSTLLKRAIAQLLVGGAVAPRNILYLDVESAGLASALDLQEALRDFVEELRTRAADDRVYLFLDEATGVRDWGRAFRTLYRQGLLHNVTAVVTGSHALDIKGGGEMAPGRRGEALVAHLDWVLMPLSFRDYVAMLAPDVGSNLPVFDLFDPAQVAEAAGTMALYDDPIVPLFARYLRTGGYPHAIASEHEAGRIGIGIYELYRQALLGQMRRAGHQEGYVREVVHWAVTNRLGQEFSWRDVAADTDIGSKDTARRYVEDAEALFLWTLLHRARALERAERALRSPRKLYPVDPFTWHVLTAWIVGGADPWALTLDRLSDPGVLGPLVEATAGAQLVRGFGARAMYYRAPRGEEEIDLVLHEEQRRAQIEIKYRKSIRPADWRALAAHGGGILATRHDRVWDPAASVMQIPVPYLLAGLGEDLSLFPARDR